MDEKNTENRPLYFIPEIIISDKEYLNEKFYPKAKEVGFI